MAATVKELNAKIEAIETSLRQDISQLRLTEDSHWGEYQAGVLALTNEVRAYFKALTEEYGEVPEKKTENNRTEPWRMKLEDFLGWKSSVKADWEPNGNAKTGQRLAKALSRTSGHAEGQLYINWCAQVGRDAVRAFWISRGKTEIPEGL